MKCAKCGKGFGTEMSVYYRGLYYCEDCEPIHHGILVGRKSD